MLLEILNLALKRLRDTLVSIETEYPVVRRAIRRELFLSGKAGPGIRYDRSTEGLGDLTRPVPTLRINNQNLIRPRYGADRVLDILLLVEGNNDGGDLHADDCRRKVRKRKKPTMTAGYIKRLNQFTLVAVGWRDDLNIIQLEGRRRRPLQIGDRLVVIRLRSDL